MQHCADEVIEGLRTGLFTFLAHPDVPLWLHGRVPWSRSGRIFAVCKGGIR